MPKYEIKRAVQIEAPAQAVKGLITDFQQWPIWSPWTIQEPECELEYFGETGAEGSGYRWRGTRIGAGDMTLLSESENRIECDLNFIKPFKSQADVGFTLESLGQSRCKIAWDMQSSMPFFLFFMIPNIQFYVGMDYERGLRMLKELAETGSVASQVEHKGEHALAAVTYLGTEVELAMKDIPAAMEKHYTAIAALVESENLGVAGAPFSNNVAVDMKSDSHRMQLGIPVKPTAERDIGAYRISKRPAYRCARFDHTGAYEHLGNCWATAMGWLRHEKRKAHKGSVGIEVYVNDPTDTPRESRVTELYIPLKN